MNLYETKLKFISVFTVSQLEVLPEFDRYHYPLNFRTCMNLYETIKTPGEELCLVHL